MGDVKRWNLYNHGERGRMHQAGNGDWVSYQDHAREVAALREEISAESAALLISPQETASEMMDTAKENAALKRRIAELEAEPYTCPEHGVRLWCPHGHYLYNLHDPRCGGCGSSNLSVIGCDESGAYTKCNDCGKRHPWVVT
jgi:hypothetical protein